MCLIAFAWNVHPDFPLLLVANRDEFYERPAAPLSWWSDQPQILAGRDLQERGTWLGTSRTGGIAAVTNVRSPDAVLRRPRSRGALASRFLQSPPELRRFTASLAETAQDYGGFNLLVCDGDHLHYLSNRPDFVARPVEPGVHMLSNAQLDTPWPKARAAAAAMQAWVDRDLADEASLLATMRNDRPVQDSDLPETGVSLELERLLSSPFIRSTSYGTRCTSLLRLSRLGTVELFERRYGRDSAIEGETRIRFAIDRGSS